jgi:hypothetical protein
VAAKKKPEFYQIRSAVRTLDTRVQRVTSPARHRFSYMLGGGLVRLTRKRPSTVSADVLQKLLPELKDKEQQGILVVTNAAGERLDLNSLKVVSKPAPASPLPNIQPDSIANDKNEGIGKPMAPEEGALPEGAVVSAPVVTRPDRIPEGIEEPEGAPEVVEKKKGGRRKKG